MEEKAMLDGMEVFKKLGLKSDEMFEIYREIMVKLDGLPFGAVLVLVLSMIKQIIADIDDEVVQNDFIKYLLENLKGDANE